MKKIINRVTLNYEVKKSAQLSDDHLAIIKTMVYSDIFDYPLTYKELYQFVSGKKISENDFNRLLKIDLIPTYIQTKSKFFTLPQRENIIDLRISKLSISEDKWKQAFTLGYLLSHFPFVKMISVTGSLVFNNIKGKDDDIDYFIIIEKHHLWTVRLFIYILVRFLELFKIKICPNYIISTRKLELDDKNFYSARELRQMIPLYGKSVFEKFMHSNNWINTYYPNAINRKQLKFEIIEHKKSRIKAFLEKILSLRMFSVIEVFEMNRQIKRLKKISTINSENIFTKDCAKCHIDGHGNWIKEKYHSTFEKLFNNKEIGS